MRLWYPEPEARNHPVGGLYSSPARCPEKAVALPKSGLWPYASPRHQAQDRSQCVVKTAIVRIELLTEITAKCSGWLRRLVIEELAVSVQRLD